ncbi:MAG: hypothetical protein LBT55_03280 [Clostridiaceae bacterium]|nr:hypothetical protein [Clostridiaceae bacterium]
MNDKIMFVKARVKVFRVLKVLSYLLGFPLMLYAVYAGARAIGGYDVTKSVSTAAFWVVAGCCIGFAALHVAIELLLRKKDIFLRALVTAITALAAITIPVLCVEASARKGFNELSDGYANAGYRYDGYEKQLSDYLDRVKAHDRAFGDFLALYNLEGTDGWLSGGNVDTTPTADADDEKGIFLAGYGDYKHYVFGKDFGGSYGMNGLYADGFIFGYKQAEYILKTYYGVRDEFAKEGLDADEALKAALAALDAEGSAWREYQKTEEYIRAYGAAPAAAKGETKIKIGGSDYDLYDLYAGHYYLTPAKVKELLNTFTGYIAILPVTGDLVAIIEGVASISGMEISEESLAILRDYRNLDYDGIMQILNDLNIESGGQVLNEEFILNLLSDLSFYQSPATYPQMFFIEDASLRDYAYAKYLGTKHGALVGSVLIGDSVGEVTLNASGNAPMSQSALMSLFARIDAEEEYMTAYYPWLSARNGLIRFGGLIPAAIILAYFFASAEKKSMKRLFALETGVEREAKKESGFKEFDAVAETGAAKDAKESGTDFIEFDGAKTASVRTDEELPDGTDGYGEQGGEA